MTAATERIVITGGSGLIGTLVRPLLRRPDRVVELIDRVAPDEPPGDDERFVAADALDRDALPGLVDGAHAVIHLAGVPSERPWAEVLAVNVDGTQAVLDACVRTGVRRVLVASSNHAVGMASVAEVRDVVEPSPRPDTYYGVSKAAIEALAMLYGTRFGLSVVAARIGTARAEPPDVRSLSTWLSPGDMARLIEAVCALEEPGGHVVWAISANTRRWMSNAAGAAIGFEPVDDAEAYAAAFGDPAPLPDDTRIGGTFTEREVGGSW